jgi:hypothetical protein
MGVVVQQFDIRPGLVYQVHPNHRNGRADKSQWTIPQGDEIQCFQQADARTWLLVNRGWGLHIQNGGPQLLGLSQDRDRALFVAKFVSSAAPVVWHGYPADHQRHPQDIPAPEILKAWLDSGLLIPAKIRKLSRGQPCNL